MSRRKEQFHQIGEGQYQHNGIEHRNARESSGEDADRQSQEDHGKIQKIEQIRQTGAQ
jgi:hypothetical protein